MGQLKRVRDSEVFPGYDEIRIDIVTEFPNFAFEHSLQSNTSRVRYLAVQSRRGDRVRRSQINFGILGSHSTDEISIR